MMMKKIMTSSVLSVALAAPTMASAAYFDFQEWTSMYGEQGFENSSPFGMTSDGLTLTATAFETASGVDSNVYMDGAYHRITGGMGVCTKLDEDTECKVSSDDNVSDEERLVWNFGQSIASVILEMGDDQHYDFGMSDFLYRYGSTDWMTATTNNLGVVELALDGTSGMIEFMTSTPDKASNFYIRNAYISSVPVPAAVWLFGSGLIGLVGIARRRTS